MLSKLLAVRTRTAEGKTQPLAWVGLRTSRRARHSLATKIPVWRELWQFPILEVVWNATGPTDLRYEQTIHEMRTATVIARSGLAGQNDR